VSVKMLWRAEPNSFDRWLDDLAHLKQTGALPMPLEIGRRSVSGVAGDTQTAYFPIQDSLLEEHLALPAPATTNAEGRFEIAGLGADRLAILEISGPNVVKHVISVVTRDIPPVDAQHLSYPGYRSHVHYGATFKHVVEPGLTVTGIVRDVETNQPLANAFVTVEIGAGFPTVIEGMLNAKTDDQGRYRIDGLPKGEGNELKVIPNDEQPYLLLPDVKVPSSSGLATVDLPIEMRRGVFVTGRVFNDKTEEPVDATVHYNPYLDNPHAQRYASYNPRATKASFEGQRYRTAADGAFRIVVIPGQGILSARTMDHRDKYCLGVGAEQIDRMNERGRFPTYNDCNPRYLNTLVEIDVPEDAKRVEYDLPVVPGKVVQLRVVDPDGHPLREVQAAGLGPLGSSLEPTEGNDTLRVIGLRDGERRQVMLYHQERNLGAVVDLHVNDDLQRSQTVILQPCGTLTGRLLHEDGRPVSFARVRASLLPRVPFNKSLYRVKTDDQGRFRYEGILPDAAFRISANWGTYDDLQFFPIAEKLSVQPGATVDVSELSAKR